MYPRAQAGATIPQPSASFHNALIDLVNERERFGPRGDIRNRVRVGGAKDSRVLVKNNSGITRGRFEILGIDDIVISPTDNLDDFKAHPVFLCGTPDIDSHKGKFVVLLQGLEHGEIGWARIAGVAVVLLTMMNDTDEYCDVKDADSASLESCSDGSAQILYEEGGEVESARWAVVLLKGGTPDGLVRWGKLDADLDYDDTTGVTFSIWELNASNAWADTTVNISNVLPPFELAHAMVPSGVKVAVEQRNGKWFVSQFPHVYEGTLAADLTVAGGTATVTVGSDSFTGCKKPNTLAATIPSASAVTITLESDGFYHVTLAPC